MHPRTCVDPSGKFVYGVHKPAFHVVNLRENDYVGPLGVLEDGAPVSNHANFPSGPVVEPSADIIYEIPNPFPFRGVTYIARSWAEEKAKDPASILLPEAPGVSFGACLGEWFDRHAVSMRERMSFFKNLPSPLKLAIAETSTDPEDLIRLAEIACELVTDPEARQPLGLRFRENAAGRPKPAIVDHALYEVIANNPCLPDDYKRVMVLRPGVQGGSEIVGEWNDIPAGGHTHVFEYLRRNSYIPWGHYAANMADDAVRYRVNDLTFTDMQALRHLYYQRTCIRMARSLGIMDPWEQRCLSEEEIETLRLRVMQAIKQPAVAASLKYTRTLWGWNFGFGYAPTRYRLHASHQQIHQQYALVPARVHGNSPQSRDSSNDPMIGAYACGDQISDFVKRYRQETGRRFFDAYLEAIFNNRRVDGRSGPDSLVIYRDADVIVFVPKAQTSQWEVQVMAVGPVGNILEADAGTRRSIDRAILIAVQILEKLGAKMITCIEYSKAFNDPEDDQRLLYAFLPRLPESPGAFSEAQLRWINGHYPEDFAAACRLKLA